MLTRNDRKLALAGVLSLALCATASSTAFAQMGAAPMTDPMVGGAAMYPTKTIVENAVNSKDHTTLVAAVNTLVKPENKATLTKILTYHVVSGRYTAADLMKMIKDGGGSATLTTVQGEPLTITQRGRHILVTDAKGDVAHVTIGDVIQSNGVIHVVDTVLMPS